MKLNNIMYWKLIVLSLSVCFPPYMDAQDLITTTEQQSIHTSIYKNKHIEKSMISCDNHFQVHYIEHTESDAINPQFPAMHITTDTDHDAWIQVFYIRHSNNHLWEIFVDSTLELYPFYTFDQDFYHTPLCQFEHPLHFIWEAHAYAIKIDLENNLIQCVGGISWGFQLSEESLDPQIIEPIALSHTNWESDWLVLQNGFSEYTTSETDSK